MQWRTRVLCCVHLDTIKEQTSGPFPWDPCGSMRINKPLCSHPGEPSKGVSSRLSGTDKTSGGYWPEGIHNGAGNLPSQA